jgi:hypothetical protein
VADGCCIGMMRGCTKLSTVPNKLPAMTMKSQCYTSMFYGCTSLTKAPELPATTLFKSCYSTMFRGCTSLTQAPALPATTLAESCYSAMFRACTSLIQAPELPATTLATSCYANMFYDCKKINYIKTNFTSWLDGATSNWLYNVASTGTFICPSTLDTTQSGTSYIPVGWFTGSAAPYEWLSILDSNYPENTISIPIATNSFKGSRYYDGNIKSSLIKVNL